MQSGGLVLMYLNEMDFGDGTWWNIFEIKLMKKRFTR